MMDGRELVQKACDAFNDAKLCEHPISVDGIDIASGKQLTAIVNKFLDTIETVPANKEHSLPDVVIDTYNSLVDEALLFNTPVQAKKTDDVGDIIYRRTKFN